MRPSGLSIFKKKKNNVISLAANLDRVDHVFLPLILESGDEGEGEEKRNSKVFVNPFTWGQ